jgi:AraC family ethanolamine operon transcriptional activator
LLADQFLNNFRSAINHNQNAENHLAHSIVDLLLNYLDRGKHVVLSRVQRKRDLALKKASTYVQEHIHDHISISDLCSISDVSERTLEYAFREIYQVSPKDYIKSIKLNKVRSELYQDDGQMISTIAAKYGFWHMGQFAADFKRQFGVLPSQVKSA